MPCMCGGCTTCLRDQGCDDLPEFCVRCGDALAEDATDAFCSDACKGAYVEEQRRADDALHEDMLECERLADEFWADEDRLRLQDER